MNIHTTHHRKLHRIPPLLVGLLALAACGGDDDDDATAATDAPVTVSSATTVASVTIAANADGTESATSDADPSAGPAVAPEDEEFCAVVAEVNATGAPPTIELVERYRTVAPAALQAPTQTVLDVLTAADGDFTAVFADPDASAALEQITAVESERCGTPVDEGPDQDPRVTVLDAAAMRVDVEATEYMFHGDLPTSPGRYSFVMTNAGEQPHLMVLLRLEDGATLDEALASEGEEGVAEQYESDLTQPGDEGVLTADLNPGAWVLLCPIPGPEGRPHFVDGMIHEFAIS